MRNGLIILEGNIGAGKSTFAKALANVLGGEFIAEPDETTNPYLADYYEDPARYAFEMQMFLLSRRYRAQKYAQAKARHKGGFVIMDRSYYGDVCFANVQKKMGYFSDRDYETYLAHHTDMKAGLEPPVMSVFLDVEPRICLGRINKRMSEKAGRLCESGISLDYLEALNQEILNLRESMKGKSDVVRVDWNHSSGLDGIVDEAIHISQRVLSRECGVYDFWTGLKGIGC